MSTKRSAESSSSSEDSDDDFIGPSLTIQEEKEPEIKKLKKRKVIDDAVLLENLPTNEHYKYSYENNSIITCIASNNDEQVVIAGFKNGMIKFWKKRQPKADENNKDDVNGQLDVIKEFMAHPGKSVVQILFDKEGSKFVSVAENDTIVKVYDMKLVDMVQLIDLKFVPNTNGCNSNFLFTDSNEEKLLVNESNSTKMYIVNLNDEEIVPIKSIHRNPIACVNYNYKYKCFISVDTRGLLEVWCPNTYDLPTGLKYKYKSETHLLEFVKNKTIPSCISISKDNELFATFSFPDNLIRVFRFNTGRLLKKFDESISHYETNASLKQINREKLLEQNYKEVYSGSRNLKFEMNDKVLIYSSVQGIKILNLQNNKVLRVLGTEDQDLLNIRFNQILVLNKLNISQVSGEALASNNRIVNSKMTKNPFILATAINSNKVFVFNNEKDANGDLDYTKNRDFKLNTKTTSTVSSNIKHTIATLHTTLGDIKLKLFLELCPKTVENFVKLCEAKYYNNIIFHRVIKGFMVQTGDPCGDGTGGESTWGGHFKDEFHPLLRHSKPFVVSMANAGPNTNGSQFFITTAPSEWLDDKHSIFGEVILGFETVKAIENVETDEQDKPIDQVAIISTNLHI